MAYLGNVPARSFISFERQVFTIVNSQTAYTLSHSVTNENDIRLVVNNVVQEPGSGKAYTASGTTLTLSAALTNGTDEMYCVFLGRAVGTVNAPAGSVGNSQTAATIITGQTAETTVANDDTVLIHDTSASALKKMTVSNLTANAGVAGIVSSADATAITIDSSENVGIGNTTPSDLNANANNLVVGAGSGNDGITIYTGTSDSGSLYFADGTSGASEYAGSVEYQHSTDALRFRTAGSERMRINSAGKVGIGDATLASNAILSVEGNIGSPLVKWYDKRSTSTVDVFSIYSDHASTQQRHFLIEADGDVFNTFGSYGSLSDRKFKENETDANSQWNDIKELKIKNYNLKISPDKQLLGVIAQDLETSGMNGLVKNKPDELYTENDVLPEGKNIGDIKEEGYKEVKYSILYMKSVKALQEAMERIETLEAKVTALENA